MQASAQERLQTQISALESRLAEVNRQISTESNADWGTDRMFDQQVLISRRDYIIEQLDELKRSTKRAKQHDTGNPSYKVRVNGREKLIRLVDPEFAAPSDGLVSFASPLGLAMKTAKPGEKSGYDTPQGNRVNLEILAIL